MSFGPHHAGDDPFADLIIHAAGIALNSVIS
jgi:hypothetical protein